MAQTGKPSFWKSVMDGVDGYLKGFFAGSLAGLVGGALIGCVIACFGTLPLAAATIGGWAITSAFFTGGIGSLAGAITGVVRSRETNLANAQDVVNLANMAFAQGVQVGQSAAKGKTSFRDAIEVERTAAELGQNQRIH